jgi:hypothetical protein
MCVALDKKIACDKIGEEGFIKCSSDNEGHNPD